MSQELTCITCPMGCRLSVDRDGSGGVSVSGNRCARGARYAEEELLAPKRVVTATVRLSGGEYPRLPVRTTGPFPKEDVEALLGFLYGLEVAAPVKRGQVLAANVLGRGVDLMATRSVE